MSQEPQRLAVSIEEAAKMLSVSHFTVRRLIKAGKIPSVRLGARRVIQLAYLEKMLKQDG
jgi:excisionase family DNA binding protein